jgi:hypothetical protein
MDEKFSLYNKWKYGCKGWKKWNNKFINCVIYKKIKTL